MPFNSFAFTLLFLPIAVILYAVLQKHAGQRWAQACLLAVSLLFYGYARPEYVLLLLSSILFNWQIARLIEAGNGVSRMRWLQLGLLVNIAALCCFKYFNFFLSTVATFGGPKIALPDWAFPLGISFFTLTQIMYLVDTEQGLNGASTLFDHATLVSLFPYISSGPLVISRRVVPQLHGYSLEGSRFEMVCRGVYLFAIGLAKKILLADSFARVADAGFGASIGANLGAALNFTMAQAWIFSVAYTFQIYFDFSGYSDMAVGSAWMLGIDIPQNFNAPLTARSISEFWQRWHISLSNFITSYLYTPILRSMGAATIWTSAAAILLAMGIAGLWHGPAWTYVVFGLLHGIGLAINQIWRKRKLKMPDELGWLLTFVLVDVAFVFFRSPNIPSAVHLLAAMAPHSSVTGGSAFNGDLLFPSWVSMFPVLVGVTAAFVSKSSGELAAAFRPTIASAAAAAVLVVASLLFMESAPRQFVYFAF